MGWRQARGESRVVKLEGMGDGGPGFERAAERRVEIEQHWARLQTESTLRCYVRW